MENKNTVRAASAAEITARSDDYLKRKELAQLKYGLIAPVVAGTLHDETQEEYYRRLSEKEITLPDGRRRRFRPATYKWWVHLYRKSGMDGLMRHTRSDQGSTRKLSGSASAFIRQEIGRYPRITGQLIYDRMISKGIIRKDEVSVDTVQRYIRRCDLRSAEARPKKERLAWEFEHACDGYEADTAYTFYLTDESGRKRRTYLIAIIDDASRLIVGARFFFHDNAANFHKVWKSAVRRYGRSRLMILDNGSSYKNGSTSSIASRLGTQLVYCRPYSPEEKAKIERFFRTVRMRWIDADEGSNYSGIDELNEKLSEWIAEYNTTEHSALRADPDRCTTPMKRYMKDMAATEPHQTVNKPLAEFSGWLDDCFLHEEKHKVYDDSTVRVMNTQFDVPPAFCGSSVIIRYEPGNDDMVFLCSPEDGRKIKLRKTDRVENSRKRREEILY